MAALVDLTGRRFGRLVVIGRAANKGRDAAWACNCDCGASLAVRGQALRTSNTRSCGCLHREQLVARNEQALPRAPKSHGMSGSRTHKIWCGMRKRCSNPRARGFHNYGGRGIKVCVRWNSFQNFLADMGEAPDGLSIDRKDMNGDYEPGNCRWATPAIQSRNKRGNVNLSFDGRTQCLTDWAIELGVSMQTLHSRLADGWSATQALSLPVAKGVSLAARGNHV
jgi:hypothetical protein